MERLSPRLIAALNQMGLSHHDALVYSASVFLNSVGAKELIDFVQISKPSVYESLQRLEGRGLVVKAYSKPAIFTPVSPRVAIDILSREYCQASEIARGEFEKLLSAGKRDEESDAIWTVFGEKNIAHKIREMISTANHHIDCMMGDKYLSLFEKLNISASISLYIISDDPAVLDKAEQILEGITVSIQHLPHDMMNNLGPPSEEKQKKLQFFDTGNIFEIITDEKETLSIPPIYMSKTTGLYSTNDVLVCMAHEKMKMIVGQVLKNYGNESIKRKSG